MKLSISCLLSLILFCSCDHSNWETIKGKGINDEPKSLDNVIYFEDENNGVVGGYTLIIDSNARSDTKLSQIPVLYLTSDAGKNWQEIKFPPTINQSVRNAYLHRDTLICQTDSVIFFSINKGVSFYTYKDSIERTVIAEKFLKDNKEEIKSRNFQFKGNKYLIKELYQNRLVSVIVCYGSEKMTDYYFVSFDKGNTWKFLQEDFGDNRQRFLLSDKFLYSYDFPFGLQRLKLR